MTFNHLFQPLFLLQTLLFLIQLRLVEKLISKFLFLVCLESKLMTRLSDFFYLLFIHAKYFLNYLIVF